MASSNAAVTLNAVCGKILSFLGYLIVIFLLTGVITYIGMGETVAAVVCFFVMAACSLFIVAGAKIKQTIRRFYKYQAVISNNTTSLDLIAMKTTQPVDFVRKDLQKMIEKKFFVNAYIDLNVHEIVFNGKAAAEKPVSNQRPNAEMTAVTCGSCGAVNEIEKGSSVKCEYCGSPLIKG